MTPPEVALGKDSRRQESELIAKKWGLLLIKNDTPESAYLKGSYSKGFTMAGFQITSPLRGRKRPITYVWRGRFETVSNNFPFTGTETVLDGNAIKASLRRNVSNNFPFTGTETTQVD